MSADARRADPRVFVDTNVLVYARDRTDEEKHRRALEWVASLWQERAGRVSWQVLHEYYVTVTRKLDPPRDRADAREDVAGLMTCRPITLDLGTIDAAWSVEDRFGLSWWDALIVGAAQVGGCTHLLSEDLQDGQDFDGVQVVSPFTHGPGELLRPT
jgi:predicted nucleic acid-binding protein